MIYELLFLHFQVVSLGAIRIAKWGYQVARWISSSEVNFQVARRISSIKVDFPVARRDFSCRNMGVSGYQS